MVVRFLRQIPDIIIHGRPQLKFHAVYGNRTFLRLYKPEQAVHSRGLTRPVLPYHGKTVAAVYGKAYILQGLNPGALKQIVKIHRNIIKLYQAATPPALDRKSTRLNSSPANISYA